MTSEKTYNPWAVAMVVSLAAFMEVLDTTITNVSLSHIAGTLGASQDESTWIITSYLVANGIVLPISGWLAGVMGRKRFFLFCIAGFTVTSFLCGIASSLAMLIAARLMQGFCGGGLQPIQQAIILDAFPPEKRGAAFGVTGITMIVAPILGPTLGGYITDNFSWEWIFFMNVPVGIFAILMVNKMVQDPPHAQAKGLLSIDYIGLSLITIGLGSLQVVLDKGQQEDWFGSHFILFFTFMTLLCLGLAIIWLLDQKEPVVDLHLLTDPAFALSCIMMFFVGATLYAGSTLLPLLVQSQYGYDATTAGLVLSPGGFAVIFLMPISGKLVSQMPARYLISLGMALCGAGMVLTSFMSPQTDYNHFVMMRVFQVLGLPFLFIPVSTLAFTNIPKEKSSKASAIFSMSRNIGGSMGIALVTTYVTRREQIHQSQMVEHLTGPASGRVYHELGHQTAILSFADAFAALAVLMGTLAVVALFMPNNNPKAKKAVDAAPAH